MRLQSSLALAAILTTAAAAQTTPGTAPKRTTRHTSSAASKPAATSAATATPIAETAANAADNPPNVPKIEGTPKTLYSLRYVDTQVGTGELAKEQQYYTVKYTGWLTDGTKFDSSYDHPGGEPIVFPYGARRVIPGWDTGFEGMRIGGKRRLFIPYQLAYGESGRSPVIPPKADLIFDIELVAQSDTPPQEKAAPAAPPEPSETNPAQPAPKPTQTPEPSSSFPPSPPPATSPSGGQPPQSNPKQ